MWKLICAIFWALVLFFIVLPIGFGMLIGLLLLVTRTV